MKKQKSLREIRDELLETFLSLEYSYFTAHTTTIPEKRVAYLEIEMCEHLLNAIKALEYHYRDDVPEMRTKKMWNEEMKNAHKVLKKYGEQSDPNSKYQLQQKFDETGYLAHREFIKEAKTRREELKRCG